MSGFGLHLKLALGSGNGGGAIASVAAWILNMLGLGQGNGSTSTTDNGTVSVFLDDAAVTDSQTIYSIPDDLDIGIQNGAQLGTTVATGARLGDELLEYPDMDQESSNWGGVGVTNSWADSELTVTALDGSSDRAEYSITGLTVGAKYDIVVRAKRGTQGVGQIINLWTFATIPVTTIDTTEFLDYEFLGTEATSTSGLLRVYASNLGSAGDVVVIDSITFKEVIPRYSYTTQDGNADSLALTQGLQTDNGTVETLVPMNPWAAGASVVAGQVVKVSTTEGIDCHVEYVSSGTSAGSQPVTSTSDIGGSAIIDNDTSYLVKGYQTVDGLFSGLAQNQYLATPDTPANQTTGSLGAGVYILFMNGTGSVSATDNTATSDAAGQSASEGTPLVITVSGAGTIDVAVTGTVDIFNLQDSPVVTPYIITSPRTATVTSEPIANTGLTPSYGAGLEIVLPSVAGQTAYLAASTTDGDNDLRVALDPTEVHLTKEIATVSIPATIAYTHQADTKMAVIYGWGSGGMKISAAVLGGVFPAVGTNANTDDAVLGTTLETGSRSGADQLSGQIVDSAKGDWNDMVALAESFGMDVSNLVLE